MVENVDRKPRKSSTAVTGRSIIEDYLDNKPLAVEQYMNMTDALTSFHAWNDLSKVDFLEKFIDVYDLLDVNCREIVSQFCNLKWNTIPNSIVTSFVQFLSLVAVHHVNHTEPIFRCVVRHFLPELTRDENANSSTMVPLLSNDIQKGIYDMAHSCLLQIVQCVPLSVDLLAKCCEDTYPYYNDPSVKLLAYNRNLILLSENIPTIAGRLWSLMIGRLLDLDVSVSAHRYGDHKNFYETDEIFTMDEDSSISSDNISDSVSPTENALDLLLAQILHYIAVGYQQVDEDFLAAQRNDINFKWIEETARHNLNMYKTLLVGFEEHILYTSDVHFVSYIWFYLCSLNEKTCDVMLKMLWKTVTEPQRSPNDWKKAQNAAALMCGFLSRAQYISFKVASNWLKTIADWCCAYVDNAGSLKVFKGGIQHGTFYATVQALLFVLCYRYREFHNLEEVHLWGLGRIIHSNLEPLSFISQAVALCFANVSRHLQIIYCNHILGTRESLCQRPVELYFPFSFCNLAICSSKILSMMRKFTPMEGLDELSEETRRKRVVSASSDTEAMDFGEIYGDDYDFAEGGSYRNEKIKNLLESISLSPLTQFSAVDGMQ